MTDASNLPVFLSPEDDPDMRRAAAQARDTFRFFWRELSWERRRIVPGLDVAAVKAAFFDPPEVRSKDPDALAVENMWMIDVDFDGKELTGTMINSPHSLLSIKEGDEVTLALDRVCDWMYSSTGELCGGFTIDLIRSRMEKSERRRHDAAWGMDFGQCGNVKLVPASYVGSKRKTGFMSKLFGAKEVPQDYDLVARTEHPMSINMRESLEDALKKSPESLHETDDNGYGYLHQLALAGSLDGVDVCLKLGADPNLAAKNGMTPLMLAKVLNWTKIIQRIEQNAN